MRFARRRSDSSVNYRLQNLCMFEWGVAQNAAAVTGLTVFILPTTAHPFRILLQQCSMYSVTSAASMKDWSVTCRLTAQRLIETQQWRSHIIWTNSRSLFTNVLHAVHSSQNSFMHNTAFDSILYCSASEKLGDREAECRSKNSGNLFSQ